MSVPWLIPFSVYLLLHLLYLLRGTQACTLLGLLCLFLRVLPVDPKMGIQKVYKVRLLWFLYFAIMMHESLGFWPKVSAPFSSSLSPSFPPTHTSWHPRSPILSPPSNPKP